MARVFSDIDSRPVPSLRSRIWRTSGHFERSPIIEAALVFSHAGQGSVAKSDGANCECSVILAARVSEHDCENRDMFENRGGQLSRVLPWASFQPARRAKRRPHPSTHT